MTWRHLRGRKAELWLAAGLLLSSVAAPAVADARGFVGFSFGLPLVVGPPAYYPPPAYYYPPPPAYSVYPPVVTQSAPPPPPQTCREYQTTTTIDGRPQPAYGTACLQPDGTWRIVR